MDLNAPSMSELIAISLVHEWKILQKIIFFYTNIARTSNFFNLLNNSFNMFLIIGLVLISCNSGSKRFKTIILYRCIQLSEELDCIFLAYFSTSSGAVKKI